MEGKSLKPENARKVIDVLYNEPVINRKKLIEITNVKPSTLKDTVDALLEHNIILETTGCTEKEIYYEFVLDIQSVSEKELTYKKIVMIAKELLYDIMQM